MPQIVSDKQLAQWRSFAARRMQTTCTVKPITRTKTAQSGTARTWGAGTETVCHAYQGLQSSGRAELDRDEFGEQILTKISWTIILPYDTTIGVDDKIEIGSQSFRVAGFPDDQSLLVQLNTVCEEIQA